MLQYEWVNPSMNMVSTSNEDVQESDQYHHIFYPNYTHNFNEGSSFFGIGNNPNANDAHFTTHHHDLINSHTHLSSLYDPPAYASGAHATFEPTGLTGFMTVLPKSEPAVDGVNRLGLYLAGRTYFSSAAEDFVNQLYRRSRVGDPGLVNSPRCQVEGCNADLIQAKHYHRRHKVCGFHSKAATVVAAGLTQRFCQQCSRFHVLTEFDNGKRSCRKRLADHNRRRRKSHQAGNKQFSSKTHDLDHDSLANARCASE